MSVHDDAADAFKMAIAEIEAVTGIGSVMEKNTAIMMLAAQHKPTDSVTMLKAESLMKRLNSNDAVWPSL